PGLALVPVPEATVDEDNLPSAGKHQIRLSWQGAAVYAVAIPKPIQQPPQNHFRRSVLAVYRRHAPGALFGAQDVCHFLSSSQVPTLPARCDVSPQSLSKPNRHCVPDLSRDVFIGTEKYLSINEC